MQACCLSPAVFSTGRGGQSKPLRRRIQSYPGTWLRLLRLRLLWLRLRLRLQRLLLRLRLWWLLLLLLRAAAAAAAAAAASVVAAVPFLHLVL